MSNSETYNLSLSTNLENIFFSIKEDVESLKEKEASEIDFSWYFTDLKEILSDLLNISLKNEKKLVYESFQFRYFLLAFAIEIAKKPIRSFWNELFDQLNREYDATYRNLIFDNIWETLDFIGIKPEQGPNGRMLVGTLRILVESDPKFLSDATSFFIHYYKNYRNIGLKEALNTFDNYENYKNKDKKEQFFTIAKKLTKVVDYVIKYGMSNLDDEEALREDIMSHFGDSDPKKLTRRRISNLVKELSNRITPTKFLKILNENRMRDVICPNGEKLKCSKLATKVFGYGIYQLNDEEYHVTPDLRISLEQILDWEYDSIGHFKNFSYYKKERFFETHISKDVRKFNYKHKSFYLWYKSVPVGEKCIIDGNCEMREGFVWTPSIHLIWATEDKPIHFEIEISKLSCYCPHKVGKELKICLNDQQLETFKLNSKGLFSRRRINFDVDGIPGDLILTVYIDGEKIKEKLFNIEKAMLFSASTLEQIKGKNRTSKVTKRRFGENTYYLFSTYSQDAIKAGKSINLNKRNNFGFYTVYEVDWNSNTNFSLKINNFEWKFEQKQYLEWWFKNNENVFTSIKDVVVTGSNNLKGLENFFVRVLNKDHEPIMESFELKNELRENFIIDGTHLLKYCMGSDLIPGEYLLELGTEDLTYKRDFYIVPKIKLKWPKLLEENNRSFVKVETNKNQLFDPVMSKCVREMDIPIFGRTITLFNKKNKNKTFPVIEAEETSVKVSFVLGEGIEGPLEHWRFITKEISNKIGVFGYRIYLKEGTSYTEINELTYYNLDKATILIFTKPNMGVDIKTENSTISSFNSDFNGYCTLKDLSNLKKLCKSYKTCFIISSGGMSKKLEINWYPKVYSIKNLKFKEKNKLNLTLDYEGPMNSSIILKCMDADIALDTKGIMCQNLRECKEISFKLVANVPKYLYIKSFTSLNGRLSQGKSSIWQNPMRMDDVEITVDKERVVVPLNKFLDKEVELVELILTSGKISKIKLPHSSVQTEFVELLSILCSKLMVLVPRNNQKPIYDSIVEITGNDFCVKTIENPDISLNNILESYKI